MSQLEKHNKLKKKKKKNLSISYLIQSPIRNRVYKWYR